MEINSNSGHCHRQEDLVTYLYDEATQAERMSFETHASECSSCRTELSAFSRVRENLGAWNLAAISDAPRMQIEVKRNSIETLRDFIGTLWTLPVWVRTTGLAATTALVVLVAFALAGTRVDVRQGTLSFGLTRNVDNPDTTKGAQGGSNGSGESEPTVRLTRSEIETMIAERLAVAAADDHRQVTEMRAQIAGLSAQLATSAQSQTRIATSLATLRTEQRALAARGQSTLGEWLFAANGTREPWGGDDEKDN
ncbi:MAG: hypothetical protein ABI882_15295 [Acidobacteriota bacterium]